SSAPEYIADATKKTATQRPANEKRRLDPGAFLFHVRCTDGDMKQLCDKRGGDERVEMTVKPIEQTHQPSRDSGAPLVAGQARPRLFAGVGQLDWTGRCIRHFISVSPDEVIDGE